jgi:hypothetical protein
MVVRRDPSLSSGLYQRKIVAKDLPPFILYPSFPSLHAKNACQEGEGRVEDYRLARLPLPACALVFCIQGGGRGVGQKGKLFR